MSQYTRYFLFIASLSKESSNTVLPNPWLLTHKVSSETLAHLIAVHACITLYLLAATFVVR